MKFFAGTHREEELGMKIGESGVSEDFGRLAVVRGLKHS